MFRGNTVNYRLLALPLKSTPSFPRLFYLLTRKIRPIIIPPWYPPPPPLAPIISTPLNSISSSPFIANETRCERTALAWLLATPPNGKLAELKSLYVHVLRRARACVPVISGFVAKWGRVRALDKKVERDPLKPKLPVGTPYHLRPCGVVPQNWQHSLQHCSTPASGNAIGKPLALRLEERRVGASF